MQSVSNIRIRTNLAVWLAAAAIYQTACSSDDPDPVPEPPQGELSIAFSASPLAVMQGERSILTWTSTTAETVELTAEPGDVLLENGPPGGTFLTPALLETTTFRVRAVRGEEETSAFLVVEVEQPPPAPPTITGLTATPDAVAFGDDLLVEWQTEDATRVEIYEDERILAVGFQSAPEGSLPYVADRAQLRFRLRAFNDDNVQTSSTVTIDVELPETSTVARRGDARRSVVSGQVGPRGTSVVEVDVTSPGILVAEVGSPRLQRCDTTLRLMLVDPDLKTLGVTGTILEPSGAAYECGRIDTFFTDEFAELTESGRYRVLVVNPGDTEVPFEVTVRQYGIGCGNGYVDPGELCDDGNEVDDDRCSASCEPNAIDPRDATVTFEVGTFLDPLRRVRVEIDEPGRSLTASVSAPGGGECGTNTLAGLVRPGGTFAIGNGANVGGCGGISQPTDAYAADLAEGVYDFFMLNPAVDPGPGAEVTVNLGLTSPRCGNAITEVSNGEQCDDGNDQAGDGCTSACLFEADIRTEVEPNDELIDGTLVTLNAVGEWTTLAAGFAPAGDVDYFAFDVPDGVGIEILTYDLLSDPTVCNAPDTFIRLYSPLGPIAENDDRRTPEFSLCSYINLPGPLDAGRYAVFVRDFDPSVLRNRYYVDVRLTAP